MCLKVSFFCEDTCKALGFTLDQQGRCVVADKPELLFLHRVVCVCVCVVRFGCFSKWSLVLSVQSLWFPPIVQKHSQEVD